MTYMTAGPLEELSKLRHPVADLAKDYLSKRSDWSVDDWFRQRADAWFQDEFQEIAAPLKIIDIEFASPKAVPNKVRLLSIQPHYFRGFRRLESAVDLNGDLVVIDGRNSTGKTSLVEAIEWVLTGEIVRRRLGDPKELSECLTNRFRPAGEDTWVECALEIDGETHTIQRTLVHDYDSKKDSRCETCVCFDGREIEHPTEILDYLFSGVVPLLMQHTLRQFVLDSPTKRRDYFERLLHIGDITDLIQKAVVGDIGLAGFKRADGGQMLTKWREMKKTVVNVPSDLFDEVERCNPDTMATTLDNVIRKIAALEFDIPPTLSVESTELRLREMQRRARQSIFPSLELLRPQRALDNALLSQLATDRHRELKGRMLKSISDLNTATVSTECITKAEEAISRSLQALRDADLLKEVDLQTCPLCEYEGVPTLSIERIKQVSRWNSARESLSRATNEFQVRIKEVDQAIRDLQSIRRGLIPNDLRDFQWEDAVGTEYQDALTRLQKVYSDSNQNLQQFDGLCAEIVRDSSATHLTFDFESNLNKLLLLLPSIETSGKKYAVGFASFDKHLAELASSDQAYESRKIVLDIISHTDDLHADLRWENAKRKAQQELDLMRNSLIDYRQTYLENRRQEFSDGIHDIWSKLREDRYSSFKQITIPKPKGRGFPVKLEVKALLDNGFTDIEVDALNVMSESQINAIGIAAFVTRSQLVGHNCVILDDPIQSMDDEHIRTFASDLLNHFCDLGFQVVVLTHNEKFAREISHCHYDRVGYVTQEIVHSRRKGIKITQGNRRVAERLNLAERIADDGDLDKAWTYIRKAMERLYLIVRIKHGPQPFNPDSWRNHTSEAMWEEAVKDIFARLAPESARRLRDILKLANSGSHDVDKEGNTDLLRAVSDIRPLLTKLRVGG